MADLVRAGKIRHFGVSNYRAWRVAEICRLCDEFGIDRPVVSQPCYNALNRMPEVEHLPACAFYGLGVVPYSPLARGVLTAQVPARRAAARRHPRRARRQAHGGVASGGRRASPSRRRSPRTPRRAAPPPAGSRWPGC